MCASSSTFLLPTPRPRLSAAAEEAAKKAAAAALTNVIESDLLSKPLALFTPVSLLYALPWEAFLDHAFAATFGRAAAAAPPPPPPLGAAAATPGAPSNALGPRQTPSAQLLRSPSVGDTSRTGLSTGGQLVGDDSGQPNAAALLSPGTLTADDRAVLSATFLRSPPGLVRVAAAAVAAATSSEHAEKQQRKHARHA